MTENQVTEIQKSLQKQEVLLQQIATTQLEILEVEKQRARSEKYQIFFQIAKVIFWGLIIWIAIVQTQKLTTMVVDRFVSQNSPSAVINTTTNSAQDLLNELLSY